MPGRRCFFVTKYWTIFTYSLASCTLVIMASNLESFTDILGDEIGDSQPFSSSNYSGIGHNEINLEQQNSTTNLVARPAKGTGQYGQFRSVEEIDPRYRNVFAYPFFNLVQSRVIEDALYSDNSIVVCAPTGSGKTVVFEMAIVQLLMEINDTKYTGDFKIIYMAPVKALCTERLTEWYSKFTKLGLLCIEVTGDTDVDFSQLKPYRVIITTPEKWDMLTRRWRDHKALVEVIKLFLIDEVHILNDVTRGPVLEAVVSRMKTIESSAQSAHRIELLQKQYRGGDFSSSVDCPPPRIRFVAVSATVSNPEDVALWLGSTDKPAVYHKFGDECRPVKLKRIVEGYPCAKGSSIFKFDIILNYKLWPIIQKYHDGKPTLIFCNTRKSVALTAETLSRELTITFSPEQKAKLAALAATIKNKKLQALVVSGVGCHHAGLLYEERLNIERAFRNRDLPILITTTTLAMGVNLPAHLVIVKNTQQYVNGTYQEYSISTVLQMVGRAGRPQFDTEATAVIMTRIEDKQRYQSLVGGSEPLQSYLHKRLPENLNSEAALGTVGDVAQCVQWLRSTFLFVRAARDPKRYLGLHPHAPQQLISKKIEELCVKAMNGLASSGLISMDEASCIASTDAGRLMSIFYLDLETMKHIMTIEGTESLERLLWIVCESHELEDMHLRVDERRCLNALNRNNAAATIRFPMKGKINTRQMKLNCIIQAVLGCLQIPDPALNQEAMKIMRIADRICKCMVAYVTRPDLTCQKPQYYSAVFNALTLAKCVAAHLWENSQYVSKQLKGIGPTFSMLLATAGKVNFRLLEESNPRDLERIMNKGAPAGNMIRKQISFLPKYQLSVKPIDENTVKIQLMLLNHNYLAENIDHLAAGDAHKSFIIVGGSDNKLLLFTSFKDRDLISVYDGCLSYEITRQQRSEYKINAHCISSTYVGIDDSYEYVFQNLEPHIAQISHIREDVPSKRITKKQTSITDTFKERKRKNSVDDITQSKEKKKRENALIERFKYLKDSFGIASKQLKENVKESAHMSNEIIDDVTKSPKHIPYKVTEILSNERYNNVTSSTSNKNNAVQVDDHANNSNVEDMDSDSFLDDEKINCIISDIENEISKGSIKSDTASVAPASKHLNQRKTLVNNVTSKSVSLTRLTEKRQRPPSTAKSNYNFIDLLEKNMDLSEDEESEKFKPDYHTGFSDAIKEHIGKYLQNAKKTADTPDLSISTMLKVDASPIGDIVILPPKEATETKIDDTDDADLKNPKSNDIQRRKFNDVVYDNFAQHQNEEIENKSGLVLNDYMHNSVNKYKTVNKETDKESDIQNVKELAVNYMDDFPLTGNKNEKCYHFIDTNKSNSPNKIIANHNVNSLTSFLNTTEQPKTTKKVDHTIGQSFGSITKTGLDPYISLKRSNESSRRINKYSYTATKIDVFTKDMPEHCVRVVRKLKLDLGVTEIVTEEKIYNSDTAPDVLNEETNNYSNLCIEDFVEDFTQQNTKMTPIRAISTKSPIETPHDLQNENTMMGKKYVNLNRSTIIPSVVLKNYKSPEIAQTVAIKDVSEYVKTTETQYQPPSKEDLEKTQVTPTFCTRNGKIHGSQANTESNIEDILQKYKQIFSTTNKEEIVDIPVMNKNNSNKISNLKPERPFKIRDLPNVKAPMHKISIDKEPIANVFPVLLRANNKELEIHTPVLDEAPLIRTKAPAELLEYTGHNILDTVEDQLNETDPVIAEPFDIEVSDNCPNIDSSMFDPKALLQCMNKERSEIVSPPPEFGDTSPCYSPELDSVLKSDGESIYHKNIFEDYPQNIHLTPSREIETWTLSREDENLYIEPTSYTVFRTNSSLIKESNNFKENIHGNSVPRNPRLSQFKFHKDKLNI